MPVEIFCCYARKDQILLQDLITHLAPLQQQGLISVWSDKNINAGTEWEREIEKHLNTAQIILLLISPDFMASHYCYSKEMTRAMERHARGEAQVIPIILRRVYWQGAPFGKLQALPMDGKAITSAFWHNLDEAFYDAAKGIRKVIDELAPVNYKEYLKKIVPAYHKALRDASKFGYVFCPECGSTNLEGEQHIDYAHDEIYDFAHCNDCRWYGESELPPDKDDFPFE